ncbi:MAG TPA: hypothetical protein VHX87_07315 [Galbitalea sp.]|nr:hypothetical protein [Galbitalea sp.]
MNSNPDQVAALVPHAFDGVFLAQSRVVSYNSSLLVEPHRSGWNGLYSDPIDHLYWIVTYPGVVRAWGVHDHTVDRYSAVLGTIDVALFDGRKGSATEGEVSVVTLYAEKGQGLLIPPGIWHTLRAQTDPAVLLNSKSPPYNATNVDKQLAPLPEAIRDFDWPQ